VVDILGGRHWSCGGDYIAVAGVSREEAKEDTFQIWGAKIMGQTMLVGQTVVATPGETNATGGQVPIVPANIAWSVDSAAIASFTVDATTAVATFTGLTAGVANVTVKDTKFNLTFTDQLTVNPVPNVPTADTIVWGVPQG
jgi:hypothetical protein